MPSLYEQVGGEPGIGRLIDAFYERILADPQLEPFFRDTSMDKLRRMQKDFFSIALGGPVDSSDMDLYTAHQGRGIQREHLSRFVEHLLATLQQSGIGDESASAIIARIATYSGQILGESGGIDG